MADSRLLAKQMRANLERLRAHMAEKDRAAKANRVTKEYVVKMETDDAKNVAEVKDEVISLKETVSSKLDKLDDLISAVKQLYLDVPDSFIVKNIKDVPTEKEVRVSNLGDIKIPDVSLGQVKGYLSQIQTILSEIKAQPKFVLPKDASDPIAVRLSDGEKFYKAIEYLVAGGGGSAPTVKSTSTPAIRGVPVLNPDGSDLSSNAAYSNSAGTDKKGLVDADRHVQADVLTMPAVTNAGTFVTQENGALLTSAQLIDDIVYTDDTSTHSTGSSKGALMMAAATPTDTAVNANDIGALAMTLNRELLVQVNTALPAGTNAIGKLATNSGVDIGDVDVLSIVPGTGATNLGKAEDAAHSTGDVGVMTLAVRSATPSERSAGPTDGDYEPFATNEVGALWVTETSSANGGDSTMNATSEDGSTALTGTAQAIKASAGNLTGYYIYNPNTAAIYVHFYNTAAASVTVGTTNPLFGVCIPATSAANLSGLRIAFSTAMSWAATTTGGGNTAPTTALEAVCWFK